MNDEPASPNASAAETIFNAALGFAPAERAAYLAGACGNHPELRKRVEALLRAHEQAEGFLPEQPASTRALASGPTGTRLIPITEKPGDRIGRYKLLQQIGEGGCGVVYMAEQEEPVRRRVALKVIKLGMDTKSVIARFEAERQALALMDHPNIAKVLDAGAAETGRPYFVMELVRGIKITDYCDQNNLSTRERLDLFIQVCHAIQHAHQKGIIHRDIKPSNILVSLHDGVPVPMVIDFGIAKATERRLTDKTLFTAFEQFIGTPAYTSPEQAEMSQLDIDTRSDIYSLGVLLYELLTGRTPFDAQKLLASGLDEMRRIIREQEPVRPSTRLSTMLDAERTVVARHRQADPPKLIHFLRGDLDWIVMKALEKDRARRYETANSLATDIERHLNSEPVAARPPSTAYRVQKFVRRNKLVVSAAAAVATVLVVGVLVSTWQAIRATQAEREQSRLRQDAVKARDGEAAQRQKAENAQADEARQRQRAEAQELAARQQAYASDMNLAQEGLRVNNVDYALNLLNRNRPAPGQEDLRDWEWRYLWQHCQRDPLYTVCQKSSEIVQLSCSPDGRFLAVEEMYGAIAVYDLNARREITNFQAGTRNYFRLAFSPVQPLLAFTTYKTNGCSVELWDLNAMKFIARLPQEGSGPVTGLAFSGDGKTLATLTPDRGLVWRVQDFHLVARFDASGGSCEWGNTVALSPDGRVVAHGAGKNLLLNDASTGTNVWRIKASEEAIVAVAISPDGKLVVSGAANTESVIGLWDIETGKSLGQLQGHRTWVGAFAFSPDGKTLASASADRTIRLWNLETRQPAGILPCHHEVWSLAFLPNGTNLVSGEKNGLVCTWDLAAARTTAGHVLLDDLCAPWCWCFSPDSRSLWVMDRTRAVARWEGEGLANKVLVPELGTTTNGFAIALAPDGRLLALPSGAGVKVWDTQRRALKVLPRFGWPIFIAPEKLILSDFDTHEIILLNTLDWSERSVCKLPPGRVPGGLACQGRLLIWVGEDGEFIKCDLQSGQATTNRLAHREVAGVALSPDGSLFCTASEEETAKLWDTATLQPKYEFRGHLQAVHSVAFSPNGRQVATGGAAVDAVKIWNIQSGQQILTLEGNRGLTTFIRFSPDGNLLGAANDLGELHIWRAPSWTEIEAAEQAAKAKQR